MTLTLAGELFTAELSEMPSSFFLRNMFLLGVNSLQWEKAVAPHSSTLAWKVPWMEEPGGLQSMGSLRVGHE